MDLKTEANGIRSDILRVENQVKHLKQTASLVIVPDTIDRGEMIANATLAYRHLEDARMRLGKVIQAYEGGVSVVYEPPDRQLNLIPATAANGAVASTT